MLAELIVALDERQGKWWDITITHYGAGHITMNDGQKIFFDYNTCVDHLANCVDNWHRITKR